MLLILVWSNIVELNLFNLLFEMIIWPLRDYLFFIYKLYILIFDILNAITRLLYWISHYVITYFQVE